MNLNRSCCSSTLAHCFTMFHPSSSATPHTCTNCHLLWIARQEKMQEQPGTPTTRMVKSRLWLYLLVIRAPSQSCISRDLSILSVAWTWNFGFTVPSPLDVTNATLAKGIRPSSTSLSLGSVPAILVMLVVEHEWSEVCFKASKGPSTRSTRQALVSEYWQCCTHTNPNSLSSLTLLQDSSCLQASQLRSWRLPPAAAWRATDPSGGQVAPTGCKPTWGGPSANKSGLVDNTSSTAYLHCIALQKEHLHLYLQANPCTTTVRVSLRTSPRLNIASAVLDRTSIWQDTPRHRRHPPPPTA